MLELVELLSTKEENNLWDTFLILERNEFLKRRGSIDFNVQLGEDWNTFNYNFEQTNQNFYQKKISKEKPHFNRT